MPLCQRLHVLEGQCLGLLRCISTLLLLQRWWAEIWTWLTGWRILAISCLWRLKLGSGFHCSGCRRGLQNSCRYLICYLIWCRASRYNLFVRLLVHLLRVVVIRGKLKLSFFSLSAPYGNWKSVLIDCFQRPGDKIVILTRPSLSKWWQDVHLICTVLGWPC